MHVISFLSRGVPVTGQRVPGFLKSLCVDVAMCVRVCVCMRACVYVCMRTARTRTFVGVCACTHICACVRVCVCKLSIPTYMK